MSRSRSRRRPTAPARRCEGCRGRRATTLTWVGYFAWLGGGARSAPHWMILCDKCHPSDYWLDIPRLSEMDWTEHLGEKMGFDMMDWLDVLDRLETGREDAGGHARAPAMPPGPAEEAVLPPIESAASLCGPAGREEGDAAITGRGQTWPSPAKPGDSDGAMPADGVGMTAGNRRSGFSFARPGASTRDGEPA